MKKLFCIVLLAAIFSCKNESNIDFKPSFKTVTADTLLKDDISIRALLVDGDKIWYAGSNGKYGQIALADGTSLNGVVGGDDALPEFRSIAHTEEAVFILNAGSPAALYKISKNGKQVRKVYSETGTTVFYDSMEFYNNKEGIAMGDPTDKCLSVIITRDGGDTWEKMVCGNLPETGEGEAAFAASDTNLIIKDDNTWMVSGGRKSRVFHSPDKGKSWKVYDTPIVQGSEMSGIFSADFYNDKIGFAVGGDFEKPKNNKGNKIITTNGGKKWKTVGNNTGFGYASCVQFVPESNGNELVTAGPSGIYYSYDSGENWEQIYDDKTLYTLRFADNKTMITAGQNKIVRLKLE